MNEDLPFDSRAGMTVEHYFPVDAEYKIVLRRTNSDEAINPDFTLTKFMPAGLHLIGSTSPRENLKAENEGTDRRGRPKPDAPAPRVLDLYLDRGRVKRFDDQGGPTSLRQIIVRGPYTSPGAATRRAGRDLRLPSVRDGRRSRLRAADSPAI